jgi:hypothetical protein
MPANIVLSLAGGIPSAHREGMFGAEVGDGAGGTWCAERGSGP